MPALDVLKHIRDELSNPIGSPVRTFRQKQEDYQVFEQVILQKIREELSDQITRDLARMEAREKEAALYERTNTPELTVIPAPKPQPVFGEKKKPLAELIKEIMRNLKSLFEDLGMQLGLIKAHQQHIMNQMVMPALQAMRPTAPVMHIMRNVDARGDAHIDLNPHINNVIDQFAHEVTRNPNQFSNEDDVQRVFNGFINQPIQKVVDRNRRDIILHPVEHETQVDQMRQTMRQHVFNSNHFPKLCAGLRQIHLLQEARTLIEPMVKGAKNLINTSEHELNEDFTNAGQALLNAGGSARTAIHNLLQTMRPQFYQSWGIPELGKELNETHYNTPTLTPWNNNNNSTG